MLNRNPITNTVAESVTETWHQKVNIRAKQFQICEFNNELAEAC